MAKETPPKSVAGRGKWDIPVMVMSRMSSRRLPGKALCVLAEKPLIQWVVEAVEHCDETSSVFVATSDDPSDKRIRKWCNAARVEWIEGSLNDPLLRLTNAATSLGCESIVRISGDSPVLDPRLIDFAVRLFKAEPLDLVTNVQVRTFPKGQSVEVIRTALLQDLASRRLPWEHREHVTSAVYQGLVSARIRNFTSAEQAPEYVDTVQRRGIDLGEQNLSVDTSADAVHLDSVIRLLRPDTPAQAGWTRCTEVHLQATRYGDRVD